MYTTLLLLTIALIFVGYDLGCRTVKDWLIVLGVTAQLWIGVAVLLFAG